MAVATNFLSPLRVLSESFRARTGHELKVSAGSTGVLYAQIRKGAPFDLFLAADSERPRRLVAEGFAVPGTRITYAVGRLSLWSADAGRIANDGVAALARGDFRHLAIANPAIAPYGRAARETLESLGLWMKLESKILRAQNVAQAFQLVATGNAALGFVALSQIEAAPDDAGGSRWDVPPRLHGPIRQDAVLLAHGQDNPVAKTFLDFLDGPTARRIIAGFGYARDTVD